MAESPWTPRVAYLCGDGQLVEQEDGTLGMGGSGRYLIDERPFPPGTPGSPMLDFFYHTPFAGIDLLSGQSGAASTDGVNTQVAHYSEHMRENSCLQSSRETVVVPAGSFDPCAQLETQIVASAERHGHSPEVEWEHAYYAGVKTAW